jgi:hypothetical protein
MKRIVENCHLPAAGFEGKAKSLRPKTGEIQSNDSHEHRQAWLANQSDHHVL